MSINIPLKQSRKQDEHQPVGGGHQPVGSGRKTSSQRPPEQTLRCPRCDSTNTKFCYYNNYNLTQPRYFCKTCRRYWTKGGALRNIPIGGGCRKNKKTKSCTSKFLIGGSSSSDIVSQPVMDFQLGGINRVNQFSSSFGGSTQNNLAFMNLDPLGFNTDHHNQTATNFQESGHFTYTNLNHNTSLTSIEALSSLNQDLHWKLQQQRLAMLFSGGGGGGGALLERTGENNHPQPHPKESGLQPILFQNLDTSRKEVSSSGDGGVGGLSTEWFFDNHYAPVNMNPASNGTMISKMWILTIGMGFKLGIT